MPVIKHKKNTSYELALPMVDSSSPASFKTGLTVLDTAYYKDGAGNWTSLAIADTFAEIGSTGVYEISLTAGELNHDYVLIKLSVSGAADSFVIFKMDTVGIDDLVRATTPVNTIAVDSGGLVSANLKEIDGQATSGNNATLNLKQLNIENPAGTALIAKSTGSSGSGIAATGQGVGSGIAATGGNIGSGVKAAAGGGGAGAAGLRVIGQGSYAGVRITGGDSDGIGVHISAGTVGSAGDGVKIAGQGTGHGVNAIAGYDGDGLKAAKGGGSGVDLNADIDIAQIAGSAVAATKLSNLYANGVTSGDVDDFSPSSTIFKTGLAEATDDHYNNSVIVFETGVLKGQPRKISDYNGTTKEITVENAFTDTPADGDSFLILGFVG